LFFLLLEYEPLKINLEDMRALCRLYLGHSVYRIMQFVGA